MIQNSKEQHKDILCLISLSDATRQQMKENGYDPDEAIKELKAIDNVDVGDITMQTISTIFRYKLVIIICHHVRKSNIDVLELSDGTLLPVDNFVNAVVNAVNNRYTGLIDLCICDSENMAKSIKALSQTPDLYRIQYVNENEETGVEYRLFQIYPKLLKFSFDPIEDYHIRYRKAFLKANEKAKKDQKEEIEDVSSLPEGTNLGTMSTSAAPETVYRNSPFPVKVYIHADGDEIDINVEIDKYQKHRKRNLKLNDGDHIKWDVSFNTRPMSEYTQYLKHIVGERSFTDTWKSDTSEIRHTFEFFMEDAFPLNGFNVDLKTTIGENELDIWPFKVDVLPYKDLLGCSTSIEVKSDENSNSELNSTNIKNVEIDDKILEAFQNDSKEEGKRPVAIGVKSGYTYILNIKEELEKKKQKEELKVLRREEILNQLLEWVDSGDWINDEVANEVKQMLLTVLGRGEIQLEDKEKDMSETLWNLLEVGRVVNNEYNKNRNTEKYGCLATAWQNLVGYFDDKKLFKRKGSPALNKDFFGNKDGYTNIDKGRPSKDTGEGRMSSRFRDVLKLLDAYCPSK